MQDEVQGWMLRVAPIRNPVNTYSDWEQYEDRDPNGKKRSFYFNRVTYETTYEQPQEVQNAISGEFNQDQIAYDGYYDTNGNWITGYYDAGGTWINTGHYDTSGNYIENNYNNTNEDYKDYALEYDSNYNNNTDFAPFETGGFSAMKDSARASTGTSRRPDPLTSRKGIKSARK